MEQKMTMSHDVSHQKQKLSLLAVVVALFLAAVDSTIVTTVLPSIGKELGHPTLYPWIMSAFFLPVALIAPLAGACGDRLGVSTTLKIFLIVFLFASFWAALSPSMSVMILARAIQGVGAGGIIVLSYSLLAAVFPAEKRGKMQGMLSGVWGLSAIVGPLLGSVFVSTLGWRAIFWFNLPVGGIAFILLLMTPKIGQGSSTARLNVWAQLTSIIFTCSLLLLVSHSEGMQHIIPILWGVMCISLVLLGICVRAHPESSPIPLQFFQKKELFSIVVLVLLSSAGLYSSVTLLPLALSQQSGSVMTTGLLIMLAALGWVLGAALCGNKITKFGYSGMSCLGMLLLAIGAFCMIPAIGHHAFFLVALALLCIGLGMGFTATTTLVLAQNMAPTERLSAWTATVQFLRNLGAAFGVNALVTLQLHVAGVHSYQVCFSVLGVMLLIGLCFALLLPTSYSTK